jgi:hypothetical protein
MAVGRPTHLFIVCSAHPHVGKTLTARLLIEFQHASERPVAAFDLGTEMPTLTEFLPRLTTVASLGEINDQLALLERLASNDSAPKVLDVGHRVLARFFTILRDIDFAAHAERLMIKPVVLFVAVPDQVSARACEILREQFPSFELIPVDNAYVTQGHPLGPGFAPTVPGISPLQLPELSPDLQAYVAQRACSLVDLHRAGQQALHPALWEEFDDWLRSCFSQLREIDVALLTNDLKSSIDQP